MWAGVQPKYMLEIMQLIHALLAALLYSIWKFLDGKYSYMIVNQEEVNKDNSTTSK